MPTMVEKYFQPAVDLYNSTLSSGTYRMLESELDAGLYDVTASGCVLRQIIVPRRYLNWFACPKPLNLYGKNTVI